MSLKLCTRCRKVHKIGERCNADDIRGKVLVNRDDAKIQRFYSSSRWTRLSKDIKVRDGCCIRCWNKLRKFTNTELEVHHIDKLTTATGWNNRYNADRLITLCAECHRYIDNVNAGQLDF